MALSMRSTIGAPMRRAAAKVGLGGAATVAVIALGAITISVVARANLQASSPPARHAAGAAHAAEQRVKQLADVNLVGDYALAGVSPDRVPFIGSMSLSKVLHERYSGTVKIGGKTLVANAQRDGDLLSMTWSEKVATGLTVHTINCDFSLEGVFFEGVESEPGHELLTGGNSDLAGTYTVAVGVAADGTTYAGTVTFRKAIGLYLAGFKPAGDGIPLSGVALRSGEILTSAMRADTVPFWVMQLRISERGATLEGNTARWPQKSGGVTELQLTKRD